MHTHGLTSSMVISVMHNLGVTISKTECHAPIAADCYRSDPFAFAFQSVQRETR
jgi:hypothetical protein